MESNSQDITQNILPIPPRFRWLRRGTSAFVILLLTLVGLRTFWGLEAHARLAEIHRAASARGEPFLPDDFRQSSVPDSENAAGPIKKAFTRTPQLSDPTSLGIDNWDDRAPRENELPAIEATVAKYRPALQLVRDARPLPKVSWDTVPAFLKKIPQLTPSRSLARILILSAKLERARGQDGLALDYIEDEMTLTRVSDTSYPAVVTHLVAVGMSSLGTNFICTSAMNLAISEHPGSGATPAQVRALIETLLDEQPLVDGAVRDFQGERAIMIDSAPKLASDMGSAEWMLEPMYALDALRVAQMRTAEAEACRQATWNAARAKFTPEEHGMPSNLDERAHMLSNVTGSMYQAVQHHFRMLTERRAAAIMLALRLYQIDHQGALPESLSELVPNYLPTVPQDPFDPAGAPIRYLPHRNPAVLYSVGPDGKDDHGSQKKYPNAGLAGPPWDTEDAVFSLAPTPRISPLQSQPTTKRAWWKDDE